MPVGGLKDAKRNRGEDAEQALVREIEAEIKVNPGLAAVGATAKDLATSHRIFKNYDRRRETGFPELDIKPPDRYRGKRKSDQTPFGDLWRKIEKMNQRLDAGETPSQAEALHIMRQLEEVNIQPKGGLGGRFGYQTWKDKTGMIRTRPLYPREIDYHREHVPSHGVVG